jgi:hypothetical protein
MSSSVTKTLQGEGVRLVPVDWAERQILGRLDAKAELGWSTGVGHEMRELVRRLIERYDQADDE